MKYFFRSKALYVTFIILGVCAIGVYVWSRYGVDSTVLAHDPVYVIDQTISTSTPVMLSHHKLSFNSPWGKEENFEGTADGTGRYTFARGVKMMVSVNKAGPKQELAESGLSADEKAQYVPLFSFTDSKIGSGDSGFSFIKFVRSVTQASVDSAETSRDKTGYKDVLALKKGLPLVNDPASIFEQGDVKGFVHEDAFHTVQFWGPNNWGYTISFTGGENVSKAEIDTVLGSIKSL